MMLSFWNSSTKGQSDPGRGDFVEESAEWHDCETDGEPTTPNEKTNGAITHHSSSGTPSNDALDDVRTSSFTTPTKAPVTWDRVHREECLRRGSLAATPAQVLSQLPNTDVSLPSRTKVVLEKDPELVQKLLQSYKGSGPQSFPSPSTWNRISTTASAAVNLIQSPVKMLARPFLGEFDYDDEELGPDHATDSPASLGEHIYEPLGQNDSVVHMDLVVQLLSYVSKTLLAEPQPCLWSLEGDSRSWNAWWQSRSTENLEDHLAQLMAKLPQSQSRIVLDVLVASGVLERHHSKSMDKDFVAMPDPETSIDVRLTLWELDRAMALIQHQIQGWTKQEDDALKQAKRAKALGNKSVAVLHLKRRRLLEQQVESAHGKLLNLEQTQQAVQSSWQNRTVVQALKTAHKTLSSVRSEMPEDVLDIVEEMKDLNQEFQDETLAKRDDQNEDELLQELNELMVSDPIESSESQTESSRPDTVVETNTSSQGKTLENEDELVQELNALVLSDTIETIESQAKSSKSDTVVETTPSRGTEDMDPTCTTKTAPEPSKTRDESEQPTNMVAA